MGHVLVVDDEPGILRFVERALRSVGYQVSTESDGISGLRAAVGPQPPDLVILDLLLPALDGRAALEAMLTQRPELRVLVLSAIGDVHARVRCLEAGAVDFLPKPFAIAELLARVRSHLRRAPDPCELGPSKTEVLQVAGVRLDRIRRAIDVNGRHVELSEREFLLAEHLMRHAGQVCSREELLSDVWGFAFDPGSNVVDVYVRRLRNKLGEEQITTIRNVGYSFSAA
jgi:DNA-binding response OmpR family regulator